jgi:hypothetical protein
MGKALIQTDYCMTRAFATIGVSVEVLLKVIRLKRKQPGTIMRSTIRRFATLAASGALALAGPAGAAVTGGPPIAYTVVNGTSSIVYLTNGVGSSPIKLYTGSSRTNIDQVDMRPGGHELAVQEGSAAQNVIKIITYNDSGVSTGVSTLPGDGCTPTGFDYHPSGDGSLIVARYCGSAQELEVRRFVNGAYEASPIVTLGTGATNAMGDVRWLADGAGFLLAYSNSTTGPRIQRHMLSNPTAPVTVWSGAGDLPHWFDVAHCAGCTKLLYTDASWNLHEVTFDDFGGTDHGVIMAGADGHYSPSGQILYRVSNKTSQQLKIDSQVLVSKGTFGGKDWRQ